MKFSLFILSIIFLFASCAFKHSSSIKAIDLGKLPCEEAYRNGDENGTGKKNDLPQAKKK
tara:strand:+ start:73 stop:252 length:180 start_codon:yes stop_codon:yes gene_type:complete